MCLQLCEKTTKFGVNLLHTLQELVNLTLSVDHWIYIINCPGRKYMKNICYIDMK